MDIVSAEKRSRMMSNIKNANTRPEILVRKALHQAGFRFRLHRKDLHGRPDIVLPRYRLAIFVNGCFWHGHESCHLFRVPKSRKEFWASKIGGNIERDTRNIDFLQAQNWRVGVIWECALKGKSAISLEEFTQTLEQHVAGQTGFFELRGIEH